MFHASCFVYCIQAPCFGVTNTETHPHRSIWDILIASNLINVLILAGVIFYLGNKYLPKIIDNRKNQLSKEIEEAKQARIKANEELESVKQKTKQAALEIEGIKEEAKKSALSIKSQIEQETEKELENLKLKIKREISSSQVEAIEEIKKTASEAALKLAEETLGKISQNEEVRKKLVEDFLYEIK